MIDERIEVASVQLGNRYTHTSSLLGAAGVLRAIKSTWCIKYASRLESGKMHSGKDEIREPLARRVKRDWMSCCHKVQLYILRLFAHSTSAWLSALWLVRLFTGKLLQ